MEEKEKEEVVNLKREKKIAQKGMKRKVWKRNKSKKIKVKAERRKNREMLTRKKRMRNEIVILWMVLLVLLFVLDGYNLVEGSKLQSSGLCTAKPQTEEVLILKKRYYL